jgi:phage shock protein PspC (stress-responsive transcriptional regulator)
MKKALKINLSGQIFHIDEDAYEKLKSYLDRISSHFSNIEESKEIIADIENRIAEIFREKLRDDSQVITVRDVEEVIDIMGRPEDIADEEGEQESSGSGSSKHYRRLYRDPENAVIGGVAAGLSAYFNIDPIVLRILFVVLILVGWGFPIIIYLVLWIAVPKAETAAQKLEMRGEKVNVSNLEKKIREEYEDVKENLKKARRSEAGQRTEDFFSRFFHLIGVIFIAFLKVFAVLIAMVFVIAGISIIASAIGFTFFGASLVPFGISHSFSQEFSDLILPFVNPVNAGVIVIAAVMVVLIPVLVIIYGLFKVLFRFKARDKALGASAFGLWILALITTITLVAVEAQNFSKTGETSDSVTLKAFTGDTLFVSVNKTLYSGIRDRDHVEIGDRWYLFDHHNISGEVSIDIEKSRSGNFEMKIMKESRGSDSEEAEEFSDRIEYHFSQDGSQLILDPSFNIGEGEKWRMQRIDLIIYIPDGKAVNLSKNTANFLDNIYNLDHFSSYRMAGKTWIMHEEGLENVR